MPTSYTTRTEPSTSYTARTEPSTSWTKTQNQGVRWDDISYSWILATFSWDSIDNTAWTARTEP